MAVKTITIDMEAYELLSEAKKQGESFSKVIKRRLKPDRTAGRLLDHLDEILLSEDTLDHVEDIVASRKDSMMEPPPDFGEDG